MPVDDVDVREAEAYAAGPDGDGPHVIAARADALHDSIVPEHVGELEYLAGRIAISLQEVQLALGIGERTLKTAIRNGEIPTVKVGGRRLVPVKALERHLEALAYASSGALDAWQAALVKGAAFRLSVARRRAVERRRYLRRKIRGAQRAGITSEAAGKEGLLLLRAELIELQKEQAIGANVARDLIVEIEAAEREYRDLA